MKITRENLYKIILSEVNNLSPELQEGVLDYLKGAGGAAAGKASDTGKSIAKSVSDKATAAKNKVGQVAGDIKSAGQQASLRADLSKATQEAGMQIEALISKFRDLLARAQSMRMDAEEQEIKAELQALQTYQETAAADMSARGGADMDSDMSDLGNDMIATSSPVSSADPMVTDMNGGDEGEWGDETPTDVDLPPLNTKSKEKPNPVSLPSLNKTDTTPFDWRSDKAKAKSSTVPQPVVTGPSTNKIKKKPPLRTKLDRKSIEQAVKANNGNVTLAAKQLGVTKDQIMKVLE